MAVLGTWFALAGSLGVAWDGFYAINRRYTVPNPLDAELALVWEDLQVAYGVTVWLLLAGAVLLVLRSLAAVSRRARAAVPGLAVLPAMSAGARRRAGLDPRGVRRVGRPVPGAAVRGDRAGRRLRGRHPRARPPSPRAPWRGCSPSPPSSSR